MNRYAVVIGNNVDNVIVWDGVGSLNLEGRIVALEHDSKVGPGWQLVEDEWIAPETTTTPLT